MRKWSGAILLVGILSGSAQARLTLQNGTTTFQSLGFLNSTTTFFSQANGVSTDGTIVTGYSFSTGGQEAFSWNKTTQTLTPLGTLGGTPYSSIGNAVSNTGLVVGTSIGPNSGTANEGYLVNTDGTNKQTLPRITPGLTPTSAFGITSTGGFIVGQGRSNNAPQKNDALLWQVTAGVVNPGTPTILPNYLAAAGAYTAAGRGITTDASIVVGQGGNIVSGSLRTEATFWSRSGGTPSQPFELGFVPAAPGISNSLARAVAQNGSGLTQGESVIIVGNSNSLTPDNTAGTTSEAIAWTVTRTNAIEPATFSVSLRRLGYLGQPPASPFSSQAMAISDSKGYLTTVVGSSTSSDPGSASTFREAFTMVLGDNTGMPPMESLKSALNDPARYNLNIPAGWKLLEATGVSADGNTIVGWGTNEAGQTEAWVVTLATPEPGSLSLLAIGTLSLLKRRARR